jgi:archaellum biogenesis ATPase FlaH
MTYGVVPARTALAEIPAEPEALIDHLLPLGVITLLAGDPKAGKTTLTWHMVHSVLTGEPFADRDATQGGVIWVGSDAGWRNELATRNAGSYDNLFFPNEETLRALKSYGSDRKAWREAVTSLTEEIKRHEVKLVVIDHLLGFAIGDDGADRPEHIKPWMDAISQVAEECNIAILVLVHNSKSGQVPHSYAILAIVRHILRLTRGKGKRITVATKGNLYQDSRVVFPYMSPEGYTLVEPVVSKTVAKETANSTLESLRSKVKEAPKGLTVSGTVKWVKENSDFGLSDSTLRRRIQEL